MICIIASGNPHLCAVPGSNKKKAYYTSWGIYDVQQDNDKTVKKYNTSRSCEAKQPILDLMWTV